MDRGMGGGYVGWMDGRRRDVTMDGQKVEGYQVRQTDSHTDWLTN